MTTYKWRTLINKFFHTVKIKNKDIIVLTLNLNVFSFILYELYINDILFFSIT